MSIHFTTIIHSIKHFYDSKNNLWCFKVIAESGGIDLINTYKHKNKTVARRYMIRGLNKLLEIPVEENINRILTMIEKVDENEIFTRD